MRWISMPQTEVKPHTDPHPERLQSLVGVEPQLRVVSGGVYNPEIAWYGTWTEMSESVEGVTSVSAQDVMVGFRFNTVDAPGDDFNPDSIVLDGEQRAQLYEVEVKEYKRMGGITNIIVSAKEWEKFQWSTDG